MFKGLITFLSPEIAASINIHVPFSLSRIIMSGLLLRIVLSVCTYYYYYYYYYYYTLLGAVLRLEGVIFKFRVIVFCKLPITWRFLSAFQIAG